MKSALASVALLIAIAALRVEAAGLDDVSDIDILRVEKASRQAHLYLVLEPAQNPESEEVLAKVKAKLSVYRYYVTSGQLWERQPTANRELPVLLEVIVTGELTSAGASSLATLKPMFEGSRTAFAYRHLPKARTSK